MVEILYRDQGCLTVIRDILNKTPDLERLCSRFAMDRAHGKDMTSVKNALTSFESLEDLIRELSLVFEAPSVPAEKEASPQEGFEKLIALKDLLKKSLMDDPSTLLTEGNLIRDGYNQKLDAYKRARDNGRQLLGDYLEEERQATGIPSLKIRYNRLIGYFFEVTNNHLSKVPSHFIRRQGVVSGERFTTDRLAALESNINGASDQIIELEKQLFLEIREQAKALIPELSIAAHRIAELDVAQSLARSATVQGWVRPRIDNRNYTHIQEGRHPVVEAHLSPGEFIPNDAHLGGEGIYFVLITGPNMAGKSTYLRQTALITIMAQIGSFVPAREVDIGLVDRIYCRVGASDNLARGESTFLTEMNETAYILRTATNRSLVIMDEVGRGTGTNDGLSIAWAVSEELLGHIKCRTLFATHYHELSELTHEHMANRSMEVLEKEGELVFLRKLKEGPSTESYGLHVAHLAGLPTRVISRAHRILERLRERGRTLGESPGAIQRAIGEAASSGDILFRDIPPPGSRKPTDERYERFIEIITALNPDRLSPMEALNQLYQWKRFFSGKGAAPRPPSRPAKQQEGPSLFDA
jgi:DNA mismatch repair protein MutS